MESWWAVNPFKCSANANNCGNYAYGTNYDNFTPWNCRNDITNKSRRVRKWGEGAYVVNMA